MIFQQPAKQDFDFEGSILVDVENRGFAQEEMEKLAEPLQIDSDARGPLDWWGKIWKKGREVPPEIQNLKREFGYQAQPFLTDLVAVAKAQNTPLDGQISVLSSNYNFFIMRCGVYILPNDREKFEALKFEISYKDERVSTYTMLPGPQTKKILEMGGKAN